MDEYNFGKRLLFLRKRAGITQEELEAKTGITRPYISQLETGRVTAPGIITFVKICEGLGVSPDEFLMWRPDGKSLLSDECYPDFAALDEQERTFVFQLVEMLAKKKEGGERMSHETRGNAGHT